MPNFFKSHGESLTTVNETTILTVPDTSIFVVRSIIISNTHASTSSSITITITDSSESLDANILTLFAMNAGDSQELLERPLVLENADILKAQAADANIFELYVSYLDRSRLR